MAGEVKGNRAAAAFSMYKLCVGNYAQLQSLPLFMLYLSFKSGCRPTSDVQCSLLSA